MRHGIVLFTTFARIARHANGWMTTPGEQDISGKAAARLASRISS